VVSSLHGMNDPQREGHMASHIERRKFLATLGGAAAWPVAARAQQPAMPVIGFLSSRSPGESASVVAGFRQGLKEAGYAEGRNMHIAFRWAEGQYDRLPVLAAELVEIQVAVILAAGGTQTGLAAKAESPSVRIIRMCGESDNRDVAGLRIAP
jgi:putative tryptophan/tyrosine transport system substrate-binding protein